LATLPPPNFQAFFHKFPANVATHAAIAVPPPTPHLVQISLAVMSQERCKDWAPQVGDPADVDLSARSRRDSVALPEFPGAIPSFVWLDSSKQEQICDILT
jgi:hypothetical protein